MRTHALFATTLAVATAVLAAPGAAQAGFYLQAGEQMYAGRADTPCATGFFVSVPGERDRMMLTAGTCGAVGAPVFHAPNKFRYGVITASALTRGGGDAMDAAIFRTEYRPHGSGVWNMGGPISGVAEESELRGATYLRSSRASKLTTGTITSVQTIGGQRHYCGGPALVPGDKGGPVALRDEARKSLRAAGIATASGAGGEMCFLPIRAVLAAFDATLVTFPDGAGGRHP
ncbi:hypothetical protein GCM10010123_38420 [Pilimelia anulata]|uniref:Uncharacterized protein n=1 Tax=Pilimelia anulata TaxID=53371 RepID=A0A8J3BCV8_9ACTN|nr:hypothetical protein [Pilimelia anulata]GGK04771.1 hypothetical protein GCM10010123_38420 [Pilimelia anulata]